MEIKRPYKMNLDILELKIKIPMVIDSYVDDFFVNEVQRIMQDKPFGGGVGRLKIQAVILALIDIANQQLSEAEEVEKQ